MRARIQSCSSFIGQPAIQARPLVGGFAVPLSPGQGAVPRQCASGKEEVLKAMRKIEIPIGIDKVNAIYAVYDIDNNGRLDYQEFVDMIHDAGSENSQWESNYGRRDKDRDYRDRRESREYDARYSSRKSRDYDDVRSSRDRDSYSSYRDERK